MEKKKCIPHFDKASWTFLIWQDSVSLHKLQKPASNFTLRK